MDEVMVFRNAEMGDADDDDGGDGFVRARAFIPMNWDISMNGCGATADYTL